MVILMLLVWLGPLSADEGSTNPLQVTIGDTAILTFSGDTSDGCMIWQLPPSSNKMSCCYSASKNGSPLCDKKRQSPHCREEGLGINNFVFEEKKDLCILTHPSFQYEDIGTLCILTLPSFQYEDVGIYKAIFLAKISDTKLLEVVAVERESTSEEILAVLLLTAFFVSLLAGGFFFYWRYLWSGRKGGKEARDMKDQNIMTALKEDNLDMFLEILGNRKLQRVKDKAGNTIFHLVARENWSNKMTPVVLDQLRKDSKRFPNCLRQNVEAQNSEESIPLDHPRKEEIFKIKLNNWKYLLPSWLPLQNITLFDEQIVDLNTQNNKGQTALHIACEEGAESVVKTLLDLHVKTDLVDQEDLEMKNLPKCNQKNSPLHMAVLKNQINIVKLLVNTDVHQKKFLLRQERNGTKSDGAGKEVLVKETAVELAARLGHLPIVRFIIEEVDDDSWREQEIELVYIAISNSNKDLLVCLEEQGVHYKTTSVLNDGEELLPRAVAEENIDAVKTLLAKKPSMKELNVQILYCEANKLSSNILELLQKHKKESLIIS